MLDSTIIHRRLIEDLCFARSQVEIARVRKLLDTLEGVWKATGVDMGEDQPDYGRFVNAVADLTEIDDMRMDEDEFEDQAHWVRRDIEEKHKGAIRAAQSAVIEKYVGKYGETLIEQLEPKHFAATYPAKIAPTATNPVYALTNSLADGQVYPRSGGPFGINGGFYYVRVAIDY